MIEFELLQVALSTRNELSYAPSLQEWNALIIFAEKQSLLAFLFSGIERLPKHQHPPMELLID